MNRRDFLASSGAVAGLAMVPASASTAVAAKAVQPARYVWAAAMAQSRGHVSAEVIARSLHLPMAEATALVSKLQARGVVGTLGANGIARATAPLFRTGVLTSVAPSAGTSVAKAVSNTAEKVIRRVANDAISDDDPAPPTVSDAEHSTE